jgi:hypothetical protein
VKSQMVAEVTTTHCQRQSNFAPLSAEFAN